MELVEFLQLCSACTGVIGALFFAVGVIRQSTATMGALSGTYFDANPHMPTNLAAQKADYVFGGGMIFVTFGLQLASFLVPASITIVSASNAQHLRWVLVLIGAFIYFALRYFAKLLAKRYTRQIWEWLKKQEEARHGKA